MSIMVMTRESVFILISSIVMAANSCCVSFCPDSDCPNCSKAECLATPTCNAWTCGTYDKEHGDEDDCLFWVGSSCSVGQPLGSACIDPDGAPSESYCEVMPPQGQRPSWATNEQTRVCARRESGAGRCMGAKKNTGTLLIRNIIDLMAGRHEDKVMDNKNTIVL